MRCVHAIAFHSSSSPAKLAISQERNAEWDDDGAAREALSLQSTDPIVKRFACSLRGSMKDESGTLLVTASGVV